MSKSKTNTKADASPQLMPLLCCPKCGGTSGIEWKEYHTQLYCGGWNGESAELSETHDTRENKTGKCIDCGKRVDNPYMDRAT